MKIRAVRGSKTFYVFIMVKRGLIRAWNLLKLPLIVPIRKDRIELVPEFAYIVGGTGFEYG
jgi:hypothetical protein